MANTASARKRGRTSDKRRKQNMGKRSAMRTAIKSVHAAIGESSAVTDLEAKLRNAFSKVDRMVRDGLIHRNKAARHKSRLSKRIAAEGKLLPNK